MREPKALNPLLGAERQGQEVGMVQRGGAVEWRNWTCESAALGPFRDAVRLMVDDRHR